MISLTSDIADTILQQTLNQNTLGLNNAIERMTTGYKINHAKDNAANYSIASMLSCKISSYNMAQDNVAKGLDMLTTAMDSLNLISSHLTRMRELAIQAANGTCDDNSLKAIESETSSRLSECDRIIQNSQYNGIKLFQGEIKIGNFIDRVEQLSENEALAGGYTVIKTADELQAMQNNLGGKYILMNDIDLADYKWTPVGNSTNYFTGELNGNGFAIKNLNLDENRDDKGLVSHAKNAKFLNIAIEDVVTTLNNINSRIGALAAFVQGCNINNCYSTGSICAKSNAGGLIGSFYSSGTMTNCYSTCDVIASNENYWSGNINVGGLIGNIYGAGEATLNNCYATGNVQCYQRVGGLVGFANQYVKIKNSYALGDVNGTDAVGGLVGYIQNDCEINSCYATGSVNGDTNVGGLAGVASYLHTTGCYAQSVVTGSTAVGALFGSIVGNSTISKSCFYSSFNPGLSAVGDNKAGIDLNEIFDKVSPSQTVIPNIIIFQAGIDSGANSTISLDLEFTLDLSIKISDSESALNALSRIDELLAKINKRQTEFGSAYNRLESALEAIGVSIENLTSAQATISDADIAEVSSEYIRQQILQQASATLMSSSRNLRAGNVMGLLRGLNN